MAKRVLNIVESGYRATLEEQDDTVLWLTRAMRAAGGDVHVLLCGNAVAYAVGAQDASGLAIGGWRQTQPPRLADDVRALIGYGARVHYVTEDARERGIDAAELVSGVAPIGRAECAELFAAHDLVLRW
jgi:hypothetical protein